MTDPINYLEKYEFAEMQIKDLEKRLHDALIAYDDMKKYAKKLENRLRSLYQPKDRRRNVLSVENTTYSLAVDFLYKILNNYCDVYTHSSFMEWPGLDDLRKQRIIPEPVFLKALDRRNKASREVKDAAIKEFKEVCEKLSEEEVRLCNEKCFAYVSHYRIPD